MSVLRILEARRHVEGRGGVRLHADENTLPLRALQFGLLFEAARVEYLDIVSRRRTLLFAPTFYALAAVLPASLGLAYAVPAGLGAAAVAYLGVLVIGRLTQKYVSGNDGAA